jgi:hypothetical protein
LSISDSMKARNRIPSSITYVRELVDKSDEPQHALPWVRETPPLPIPAHEAQLAVSRSRETPPLPLPGHPYHCRNCLCAGIRLRLHASVQRIRHLQEGAARAPSCPPIRPHDLRDLEHAARQPAVSMRAPGEPLGRYPYDYNSPGCLTSCARRRNGAQRWKPSRRNRPRRSTCSLGNAKRWRAVSINTSGARTKQLALAIAEGAIKAADSATS